MKKGEIFLGLARIGLGLVFLWAFFDKLLGLGFATSAEKAWIAGGSPTFGFLSMATKGPFAVVYKAIAGNVLVDGLFMIGLLLIGLSLILGVMMNLAGYSGAILVLLMWSAVLPPENHPFMDDHVIYALILLAMIGLNAGDYLGFGKVWGKFVGRKKWLK